MRNDVPRVEILGISADSRQVKAGDLFVAVQGKAHDGHTYIADAVAKGAKCVLTSREVDITHVNVPMICNADLVSARNQIAARFYGEPSRAMTCVGVTGTNGKSSIAYGLASVLPSTGFSGSIGWGMLPSLTATDMTTADGVEIQQRFATLRASGATSIAMEVSSHALDQGRLSDVQIDVGVFTNLTRDHLDYHGSMAAYAQAKARLFEEFDLKRAVINLDDALGRQLVSRCDQRGIPVISFGSDESATICYEIEAISIDGVLGSWRTKWGSAPLRLPVRSEFGVANCAAILGTLMHLEDDLQKAVKRLESVCTPPGRFEFVQVGSQTHAVIDYAHTPDALRQTLLALKRLKPSAITCVFGCGGDRDKGKRAAMGTVAEEIADRVVVTSDNPRNESAQSIADDVLHGMRRVECATVELDRRRAIACSLQNAAPRSIVLIAGKGAEQHQEIAGVKHPFSDRQVVEQFEQEGRRATLDN